MDLAPLAQKLKSWERSFKEIYGRKPLKADVEAAPANVREDYRCYNRLRAGKSLDVDEQNDKSKNKTCRLKRAVFSFSENIFRQSTSVKSDISKEQSTSSKTTGFLSRKSNSERWRKDDNDFNIHSLAGLKPKIASTPTIFQRDSDDDEYFQRSCLMPSPYEIAIRRRNLCNLAFLHSEENNCGVARGLDDEKMDDNAKSSQPFQTDDDSRDEVRLEEFGDEPLAEESESKKGKKPKNRSALNFLRLNMKNKRYQCKALKRLKGASLKRFIHKQKMRKQRSL